MIFSLFLMFTSASAQFSNDVYDDIIGSIALPVIHVMYVCTLNVPATGRWYCM